MRGALRGRPSFLFPLHIFAAACLALTLCAAVPDVQGLAVTAHAELPPGDLADAIEALIATGGQRVRADAASLDFWWVKTLPLLSATRGVSWAAVEEGTLVGAVTLSAPFPVEHGQLAPAGLYTLRYALQLTDAGRTGAPAPERVLLLAPAADDDDTDSLGHDDALALARRVPGTTAPRAWRIDDAPNAAEPDESNDCDRSAITIVIPASRDGEDVGALTFRLVLGGDPAIIGRLSSRRHG